MPRARTIKPGFFANEELAECGIYAHLLFAGLWCWADREGRLEDRPRRLKGQIFPLYDGVDVDQLLDCLHAHNLITRYQVDDMKYIQITSFAEHQHPHRKEIASQIPPPGGSIQEQPHIHEPENQNLTEKKTEPRTDLRHDKPKPRTDLGHDKPHTDPACYLILDPCKEPCFSLSGTSKKNGETSSVADHIPVFVEIPLKGKSSHPVTYARLEELRAAYPGIDVEQELRNIQQWNIANPSRRKTKRGIERHITTWLSRAGKPASTGKSAVDIVEEANRAAGGQTYDHE